MGGFSCRIFNAGNTHVQIAELAGDSLRLIETVPTAEFRVEDFAVALIKFENGATLELEASWCANIKEREHVSTRLLGTRAGLLHHNIGDVYDSFAELYLEKDGCQYDMKLHPPVPEAKTNMYHFVDAILNDRPHMAGPEEGLMVMRILDAVYESAGTGKPVRVRDIS